MVKNKTRMVSTTLHRAMQILEFISENQPASAPKIQRELGMTKGSVYHVLASLEALDYVRKEDGVYYLTFKLYAMGQTVPMALDFIEVAKPWMNQLAADEQLNIYLAVPDVDKMVGVFHVKPQGSIQVANDFSLTYELHCTASGKLWLATMPKSSRLARYPTLSFQAATENTITESERLEEEVERISKQGYSIELMEHSPFINGVAAPIYDHRNIFVASLSAVGPTLLLPSDKVEMVGKIVAEKANQISQRLGARMSEGTL